MCVCVFLLYSVQLGGQRSPLSTTRIESFGLSSTQLTIFRNPEGKVRKGEEKKIGREEGEWKRGVRGKEGPKNGLENVHVLTTSEPSHNRSCNPGASKPGNLSRVGTTWITDCEGVVAAARLGVRQVGG